MTSKTIEELFDRLNGGDQSVEHELFQRVYSELHALARAKMAKQRASHTLQATALVNEAYLKLGGRDPERCADHAHFLRLAGTAMRQILVDHARKNTALRRSAPGRAPEVGDLDELAAVYDQRAGGLADLEAALTRLQTRDPDLVHLIELRFFAGQSMEDVAKVLGISVRSAARRWDIARTVLKRELSQ
jgi:RNA polymerase sigma factor (TIGR02999 family)